MPIGITLLFLMAIAPVLPWRKASTETLRTRLLWPGWIGTGVLVFAVLLGARGLRPAAGLLPGRLRRRLRPAPAGAGHPAPGHAAGLLGRTNGGMIVHLGVIMIAVAFAASSAYQAEREARLCVTPREGCPSTITVAGHDITYLGPPDRLHRRPARRSAPGCWSTARSTHRASSSSPTATSRSASPRCATRPPTACCIALLDPPTGSGGPARSRSASCTSR